MQIALVAPGVELSSLIGEAPGVVVRQADPPFAQPVDVAVLVVHGDAARQPPARLAKLAEALPVGLRPVVWAAREEDLPAAQAFAAEHGAAEPLVASAVALLSAALGGGVVRVGVRLTLADPSTRPASVEAAAFAPAAGGEDLAALGVLVGTVRKDGLEALRADSDVAVELDETVSVGPPGAPVQ